MNHSSASMNPEGGDGAWRADIQPGLDNRMARSLERDHVKRAWERVKSNQGAPGSDGMTLACIIHEEWHKLEKGDQVEQIAVQLGLNPEPGSETKQKNDRQWRKASAIEVNRHTPPPTSLKLAQGQPLGGE